MTTLMYGMAVPDISNSNNTPRDIYKRFLTLRNLFRKTVGEECGFRMLTFYRKVEDPDERLSMQDGRRL